MTMAKKAMRKATRTLGNKPNPNQTTKRGAMAVLGTPCEETRSGYAERAKAGHRNMARASGMPTTMLSR
jgi:hypothetical protein